MTFEHKFIDDPKISSCCFTRTQQTPACIGCTHCAGAVTLVVSEDRYRTKTIIAGYYCKIKESPVDAIASCLERTEKLP